MPPIASLPSLNSNGHGHSNGAHAVVTEARPLLLLRHHPEATTDSVRVVHLVPLPEGDQPAAVSALCGALLRPEQVEQVNPGSAGTPCTRCVLSQASTGSPIPSPHPRDTDPQVTAQEWDTDTEPVASGVRYRQWGWPVVLRRDQVWLPLNGTAIALLIPTVLAIHVAAILVARRCPPLLVAHPATPDHRVLLGSEPYPVPLGWPAGVHRITPQVLLPPSVTERGPLSWVTPPQPDALRLTREIDICAALRTALAPPPSDASSTS